jgi:hypothetical protein
MVLSFDKPLFFYFYFFLDLSVFKYLTASISELTKNHAIFVMHAEELT